MSVSFSSDLDIAASQDKVFACMTDLPGCSNWMHGLIRMEQLTDGDFGRGTIWRETRKMYGREAGEVFEVTDFEPPRSFALYVDGSKGATGKGEYKFAYTLTPIDDGAGTRVHMDGEIEIPGLFFKLFGKLLLGTFTKAMDKDNQSMKRYLETGETLQQAAAR